MSFVKGIAKQLIANVPESSKTSFLTLMSKLPPSMRTRLGYQLAGVVNFYLRSALMVTTSMGISRSYRYQVQSSLSPVIAWGKPQFDVGEWHSMLLAGHLAKDCSCFVDIGSFLGYYVFYVRAVIQESKPIYFFEPISQYFDQIQRNVTNNQLKNVVGFSRAVSDVSGRAVFYRNVTHASCGSLTNRYTDKHKTQVLEVETISFNDFVRSHDLSDICIKIDIEGAEHLFLKGANETLDRIRYMIIEVLDAKSEFLKNMKAGGFEVYHITTQGLVYCPQGTDEYVPGQWNWLMCRLNPEQLQNTIRPARLQVIQQITSQVVQL